MKVFVPCHDDLPDVLENGEKLIPYQVGLTLLGNVTESHEIPAINRDEASACPPSEPPVQPPSRR
jgi:hypothetical protein